MPLPLPESEFRTQLLNNDIISKEKIINLNTQILYQDFKKYQNGKYKYIKDENNIEDSMALDYNYIENKEKVGDQPIDEFEEENYKSNIKMDMALNALEGSVVDEENIDAKAEELMQEVMYGMKMKMDNDEAFLGVPFGGFCENDKNKIIVGHEADDSLDEMLNKLNNK